MNESKQYNGWANYETWVVALWLDNDRSTYEMAREHARTAIEEAPANDNVISNIWTEEQAARFGMADWLKDWVSDDLMPDLGASLAADLLGAALSEVDWNEIASHYLDDIQEEARRA